MRKDLPPSLEPCASPLHGRPPSGFLSQHSAARCERSLIVSGSMRYLLVASKRAVWPSLVYLPFLLSCIVYHRVPQLSSSSPAPSQVQRAAKRRRAASERAPHAFQRPSKSARHGAPMLFLPSSSGTPRHQLSLLCVLNTASILSPYSPTASMRRAFHPHTTRACAPISVRASPASLATTTPLRPRSIILIISVRAACMCCRRRHATLPFLI